MKNILVLKFALVQLFKGRPNASVVAARSPVECATCRKAKVVLMVRQEGATPQATAAHIYSPPAQDTFLECTFGGYTCIFLE